MTEQVFVYVTASSHDEAVLIGKTLVEERLAACANILADVVSVYRWEGVVQHDKETAIILKTRSTLIEALTNRVKDLHSYDCPCVVAMPISGGNPDFLNWIVKETAQ